MDDHKILSSKNGTNPEVFTFLDEVLPFDYDADVFNWEYGHEDKTFCYIEDLQGQVVGAQGMIPIPLVVGNTAVRSAKSETSYLAASAQGKGLFKKLYAEVIEETKSNGIDLIWGFTVLGPVWRKLGFQVKNECLYSYSMRVRPKSLSEFSLAPRKAFAFIRSYFDSIKTHREDRRSRARSKVFQKQVTIENELAQTEDVDKLYEQIKQDFPSLINLELNQAFIKFRLDENPFVNYTSRYVYSKDRTLLGYCHISIKEGTETAYISDITAVDKATKELLMICAISEVRKYKNIRRVNMFGNILNPMMAETLGIMEQFGTTNYDTGMYIVLLSFIKEHQNDLNEFSNWYINGLWTEGIKQ